MDYLLGQPGAERDSPGVKLGKAALKERLQGMERLVSLNPSERARLVIREFTATAPEAFFVERIAVWLMISAEDLERYLAGDGVFPQALVDRLAWLLGLKRDWFFAQEAREVLESLQ